ncbi:MAG: hypothetical protein M1832_000204 [Thelocarpon impressellum]|nr:MAG: hypothetical protein M1832_000204 [Thelocarpon impressellum]
MSTQEAPTPQGSAAGGPSSSPGVASATKGLDGVQISDATPKTTGPEGEAPKEPTKTALKKAAKAREQAERKAAKERELAARQAKEDDSRQAALEEAKKVVITEDPTLPPAVKITTGEKDPQVVRLRSAAGEDGEKGTRVEVSGWVHRLRAQKDVVFITLQDGYGDLQCVLGGQLTKTYDALTLTRETTITVYGEMWEVPGKQHAPDGRELHADYYKIMGAAPGDKRALSTVLAPDADPQTLYNHRHLALRGDTLSSVLKVRSAVLDAFRQTYREIRPRRLTEVDPPALVQTSVEGGSTLFELNYFGEKAYLTQSSQLYLETLLSRNGDVFCVQKSFRAEKSLTRRHLSEYTHIEAELAFISFDDLLAHLELVMTRVIDITLADPHVAQIVRTLNPDFKPPQRPFMRMRYEDAIAWLNAHDILNEEGKPHAFGDDIAEAAERKMTDIINRPIFLTHFPVSIKAFYMEKAADDRRTTESVDCLMPGVGEIVGGSMRIRDYEELMAAFAREKLDPAPYYWYTEQREYGTCPHGGYGLGLERFLAWLCARYTRSASSSSEVENDAEVKDEDSDEEPVTKRQRHNGVGKAGGRGTGTTSASTQKPRKNGTAVKAEAQVGPDDGPAPSTTVSRNIGADVSSAEESAEESAESDEEERPDVVAKAREKVQTTLQSSGTDPYPDWKAGDPVPYAALCTTFSLIELTTKRLIISSHCSLFLRQVLRLTPHDLLPTVQLMINKLAADYAGIELGIGESLIMKAIGETTGRSLATIKADQNEIGDLGLVAAKSRSNQPTMFKPKPLTVRGVHEGLMGIATVSGNGAQGRKIAGIKKLLSAADAQHAGKGNAVDITKDKGGPSEAKYIIRFLEGKLRLGLAEKTVLVALAHAMVAHEAKDKVPSTEQLAKGEAILKSVYSELPNYEVVIPAMVEHGIFKLRDQCKLQPGVPLKPMLANPTKSITEVLNRFENKNFTCEYKYDGERAQIHFVSSESPEQYPGVLSSVTGRKGLAAVFSRNSEDLSKKYPDVLAKLDSWVKKETQSFVLDCETVAWDVEEKKVLPFQQLMTRKKKDVKIEDVKVKVCVFAFDLLFLNGESVVKKTFRERRQLLHDAFAEVEGEFAFATYMNTSELDEIQTFLDQSVKASCEGLMVKMLDGEESGYEPSKRSRNWLKVKKDYLAGVGDSLDLVVLGAYYGKGKRTSVYGAFLLACYNSSTQTYETVCNIGTGFSEALLEELHGALSEHVIDKPKPFYAHSSVAKDQPDVWFEARFVWEVKAADLTLSPRYRAAADAGIDAAGRGISLRFPRFIKRRDDKKPEQATPSRMVAEMYRKQESVAKTSGPAVDDDFEY